VSEKDDDVVFVALGALGSNQVIVEVERQEWRTLEQLHDGISPLRRNIPKKRRGVVIPETKLAHKLRRRGADDGVPFVTYKRKRVPPVLVSSRFGKDTCAVKSEDFKKNVVGELIYS